MEQYFEIVESEDIPQLANQISDIEAAKLYTSLGYALDSLYCVQLRLEGTNPTSKPEVKRELERVKVHMAEIRKIETEMEEEKKKEDKKDEDTCTAEPNAKKPCLTKGAKNIVSRFAHQSENREHNDKTKLDKTKSKKRN